MDHQMPGTPTPDTRPVMAGLPISPV